MRDFAAQPAADAAFDHRRRRIGAQRIGTRFIVNDGQPESRMQEWSPVQISSSTPNRAFTTRSPRSSFSRVLGADAALPRQHAFAVGDDDLEAVLGAAHRLRQGRDHFRNAVGAYRAQPGDAGTAFSMLMPVGAPLRLPLLEGRYCWPVAEA